MMVLSLFAFGVVGGCIFLLIWECISSPIISTLLSTLVLGSCVAATISYFLFGKLECSLNLLVRATKRALFLDGLVLLRTGRAANFLAFAIAVLFTVVALLYFTKFVSCFSFLNQPVLSTVLNGMSFLLASLTF